MKSWLKSISLVYSTLILFRTEVKAGWIFGIFACLFTIACQDQNHEQHRSTPSHEETEDISFEDISPLNVNLSRSLQINNVTIFENSGELNLADISQALIIGDRYYLRDRKLNQVSVFDSKGDFLFHVGNMGKGPGEFLKVANLMHNPVDKTILVYSYDNSKVSTFDYQGDWIEDQVGDFFSAKVAFVEPNKYAFFTRYIITENSKNYNLLLTDENLIVSGRYLPFEDKTTKTSILNVGLLHQQKEVVLACEPFGDTIYAVHRDGVQPRYSLNFGSATIPEHVRGDWNFIRSKEFIEEYGYLVDKVFETDEYLFFQYKWKNRDDRIGIWDRAQDILYTDYQFDTPLLRGIFFPPIGVDPQGRLIIGFTPDYLHPDRFIDDSFHQKVSTATREYFLNHLPEIYDRLKNLPEGHSPVLLHYNFKISHN